MEFDTVHQVALYGFIAAVIFGYVANKTQFCTMGSVSDWVNMGSKVRLRAWILAIGVAIIGAQGLQFAGWVDLGKSIYLTTSFGWLGYLLGGFLFGIGMTLGSGCAQKTLVKIGGGNLKSVVVLLVMGITAYTTLRGLLGLLRVNVINTTNVDLSLLDISSQSIPGLLAAFTGWPLATLQPLIAGTVGIVLLWVVFKDRDFRGNLDSMLAGITLGLLIISAWYVTGVVGNDDFEPVPVQAITFVAPSGNTINYLMTYTGSVINFGIAITFGIIFGSFLYALFHRSIHFETFTDHQDMINHLIGAMLMGFGGVISLGCTIGQGVSGVSTLALGSLMTLVAIVFGSALTMKIQYYLFDFSFPTALRHALADLHLLPALRAP